MPLTFDPTFWQGAGLGLLSTAGQPFSTSNPLGTAIGMGFQAQERERARKEEERIQKERLAQMLFAQEMQKRQINLSETRHRDDEKERKRGAKAARKALEAAGIKQSQRAEAIVGMGGTPEQQAVFQSMEGNAGPAAALRAFTGRQPQPMDITIRSLGNDIVGLDERTGMEQWRRHGPAAAPKPPSAGAQDKMLRSEAIIWGSEILNSRDGFKKAQKMMGTPGLHRDKVPAALTNFLEAKLRTEKPARDLEDQIGRSKPPPFAGAPPPAAGRALRKRLAEHQGMSSAVLDKHIREFAKEKQVSEEVALEAIARRLGIIQ